LEELLYTTRIRNDTDILLNDDGTEYEPVGDYIYFEDMCKLYNVTTEEIEEDLFENADEEDMPVPIEEKVIKLQPQFKVHYRPQFNVKRAEFLTFLFSQCFSSQKPLDFIYERHNDTYNLSRYDDDKDLLKKI